MAWQNYADRPERRRSYATQTNGKPIGRARIAAEQEAQALRDAASAPAPVNSATVDEAGDLVSGYVMQGGRAVQVGKAAGMAGGSGGAAAAPASGGTAAPSITPRLDAWYAANPTAKPGVAYDHRFERSGGVDTRTAGRNELDAKLGEAIQSGKPINSAELVKAREALGVSPAAWERRVNFWRSNFGQPPAPGNVPPPTSGKPAPVLAPKPDTAANGPKTDSGASEPVSAVVTPPAGGSPASGVAGTATVATAAPTAPAIPQQAAPTKTPDIGINSSVAPTAAPPANTGAKALQSAQLSGVPTWQNPTDLVTGAVNSRSNPRNQVPSAESFRQRVPEYGKVPGDVAAAERMAGSLTAEQTPAQPEAKQVSWNTWQMPGDTVPRAERNATRMAASLTGGATKREAPTAAPPAKQRNVAAKGKSWTESAVGAVNGVLDKLPKGDRYKPVAPPAWFSRSKSRR